MEHIRRKQVRGFKCDEAPRACEEGTACGDGLSAERKDRRRPAPGGGVSGATVAPAQPGIRRGERSSLVQVARVCCLLSTLMLALTACASRAATQQAMRARATENAQET